MDLKDTVAAMCDADYKMRFRAEYHQLRIRVQKLENMIIKAEAGKLDFVPTSPLDILRGQLSAMQRYLHYLRVRAVIEDIRLLDENDNDGVKNNAPVCDGNCQDCPFAMWSSPEFTEEEKVIACLYSRKVSERWKEY